MRKSLVITFRNEVTPHCTTEACRAFKNRRKLAATTLVSYYFTLSFSQTLVFCQRSRPEHIFKVLKSHLGSVLKGEKTLNSPTPTSG